MKSISAKKLKKLGGKMPFSSITSPKKAIPKSNPRQQAKRKAGYRKLLSGKEYKAARAEAFKRAGVRCEFETEVTITWSGGPIGGKVEQQRCFETLNLEAHHIRYPKVRPLAASDLKVLCNFHHRAAESFKIYKTRMF